MPKNHFLFDVTKNVVNELIPSGIPQYLYIFHKWIRFSRTSVYKYFKSPKIFNIEDLSFGFVLWLIACGISFIVFVLEMIMWPKVVKSWISKWEAMQKRKI